MHALRIGSKADVDRYMMWALVLLILLVIALVILYTGAYTLIENLLLKQLK